MSLIAWAAYEFFTKARVSGSGQSRRSWADLGLSAAGYLSFATLGVSVEPAAPVVIADLDNPRSVASSTNTPPPARSSLAPSTNPSPTQPPRRQPPPPRDPRCGWG